MSRSGDDDGGDVQLRVILPPMGNVLRRLLFSSSEELTMPTFTKDGEPICTKCHGAGFHPYNIL